MTDGPSRADENDGDASSAGERDAAGGFGRLVRKTLDHWWPLLGANLVWSAVAVVVAATIIASPFGLVLVPVLSVPLAGLFRVATRIVRERGGVGLDDALDGWRVQAVRSLGVGGGFVAAWVILALNIVIGTGTGGLLGWAIAIVAAWTLVGTWLLFWTAWPLLTDPERENRSLRDLGRVAAILVLAEPVRIGILGLSVAILLILSTVAVVPLVTVSLAIAGLASSAVVLPAADRLESRPERR
jgi:uncharacterized membrane protein YesL